MEKFKLIAAIVIYSLRLTVKGRKQNLAPIAQLKKFPSTSALENMAQWQLRRLDNSNAKSSLRSSRWRTIWFRPLLIQSPSHCSPSPTFPNHGGRPTINPSHGPIIDFKIQHPRRIHAKIMIIAAAPAAHKQSTKIGRPCVANWRSHGGAAAAKVTRCLFLLCVLLFLIICCYCTSLCVGSI